ncbi:extensin family protein [Myxococcota bacterium]|nr:extensin family protein [Myxococcota bacterium]
MSVRPTFALLTALAALAAAACSDPADGETEFVALDTPDAEPGGSTPIGPPTQPPSVGGPRRDATTGPGPAPAPDARLPGPPDPEADAGGPVPPDPEPDAGVRPPPDPDPDAGPVEPPPPDVPPGDAPGNVGFIGASCAVDADCTFAEAFCLGADEGYPNGMCSQDCDRFCPDQAGASVTFCVGELVAGGGACVQQCDYAAFETGCRPGYGCRQAARFNEAGVTRQVCLPGEAGPPPGDNPCAAELNRRRLDYLAADNPMDQPDGAPGVTCDVVGALRLRSPVGGVDYRYVDQAEPTPMFMGCHLALALDDLSAYLRELDVVELVHIGTYNCRVIAGTDSLSMHGLGLAIDIHELRTSDGTTYNVERDWEHTDDPQTREGRFLYEFGQQMFARGIFNIVLTPNYNAAHDNHFHVDLTPGGNFLGVHYGPVGGVFPNLSGD